jgi:hypothetical protein
MIVVEKKKKAESDNEEKNYRHIRCGLRILNSDMAERKKGESVMRGRQKRVETLLLSLLLISL